MTDETTTTKMGKLILARHHESEWNKLGKWTGVTNVGLTPYGLDMSKKMGELIQDIPIKQAFASTQTRSFQTLLCMQNGSKCIDVPTIRNAALNERDYGDYTGKNKWEMEKLLGEEKFKAVRRGWDCQIPNGESLKMVYDRAVPYFLTVILPRLMTGENILVVAHGNSLRCIIKYIENVSDEGIADVEMPFGAILIYDLDATGHLVHKEVRQLKSEVPAYRAIGNIMKSNQKNSKVQIVGTLGPISSEEKTLRKMVESNLDVVRLNFSWSDLDTHTRQINLVRKLERELDRRIPIIIDLPGPRIQEKEGHTYNHRVIAAITPRDLEFIKFAAEQGVEYIAVSFVGSAEDILMCRSAIEQNRGTQKIIAKIERKVAVQSLEEIIEAADAVMVARGDLGNEVPLEQIPFVQEKIVKAAKAAGKPVIVATQMMFSMVDNPSPTRAEVTDVEAAVMEGADAVMLSDETAKGKYPVEAVAMMEKIIVEAEKHVSGKGKINSL